MKYERRRQERVTGYAKAVFVDTMTPGYLRDVSSSGAQVAFVHPVHAEAGQKVAIQVIAVHDATIAPFRLELDVHWVKDDPLWFSMGGEIRTASQQDAMSLRRLVEYYAGPRN